MYPYDRKGFYNVRTTRQTAYEAIEKVKEVFRRISFYGEIPKIDDDKLTRVHASVSYEGKAEHCTVGKFGMKEAIDHNGTKRRFLFRIKPCYGSQYYDQETLDQIAKESDSEYIVFEYAGFKISLILKNIRKHRVNTNWGIEYDIFVEIRDSEGLICSENIEDKYWDENIVTKFIEKYELKKDGVYKPGETDPFSVPVVKYIGIEKNGNYTDTMGTLNLETRALNLDITFTNMKEEFIFIHGRSFKVHTTKEGLIRRVDVSPIKAWIKAYRQIQKIEDIINLETEVVIENIEGSLFVSGVEIPKEVIDKSNYFFIDIEKELLTIEDMTYSRTKCNTLSDYERIKAELVDAKGVSNFILFSRKRSNYVSEWEEMSAITELLQLCIKAL